MDSTIPLPAELPPAQRLAGDRRPAVGDRPGHGRRLERPGHSLAEMNAVTDARAKARTGRFSLEHLLSLFKDVETGTRGFVITSLESYLAPYRHGLQALPTAYR